MRLFSRHCENSCHCESHLIVSSSLLTCGSLYQEKYRKTNSLQVKYIPNLSMWGFTISYENTSIKSIVLAVSRLQLSNFKFDYAIYVTWPPPHCNDNQSSMYQHLRLNAVAFYVTPIKINEGFLWDPLLLKLSWNQQNTDQRSAFGPLPHSLWIRSLCMVLEILGLLQKHFQGKLKIK